MNTRSVQTWWQRRSASGKSGVIVATTLVVIFLLYRMCIAPAIQTVIHAGAEQKALDARLQAMKSLQAEARLIQIRPKVEVAQSRQMLGTLTQQYLGAAGQVRVTGDQVAVIFRNVPAESLGQWLQQARIKANALPGEAHLVKNPALPSTGNSVNNETQGASWDGAILLNLRESP